MYIVVSLDEVWDNQCKPIDGEYRGADGKCPDANLDGQLPFTCDSSGVITAYTHGANLNIPGLAPILPVRWNCKSISNAGSCYNQPIASCVRSIHFNYQTEFAHEGHHPPQCTLPS